MKFVPCILPNLS